VELRWSLLTKSSSPSKDVGNGVEGVLHSLSFPPGTNPHVLARAGRQVEAAAPGQVVVLDTPPLYVNVELQLDESERREWSATETLVKKKVVTPTPVPKFTSRVKLNTSAGYKDVYYRNHAFDMTFAVTFHKVSGSSHTDYSSPFLLHKNTTRQGKQPFDLSLWLFSGL